MRRPERYQSRPEPTPRGDEAMAAQTPQDFPSPLWGVPGGPRKRDAGGLRG